MDSTSFKFILALSGGIGISLAVPGFLEKGLRWFKYNSSGEEQCRHDVPFWAPNRCLQVGIQCGSGKLFVDRKNESITVTTDAHGTGTEIKTIPALIFADAVIWDANYGVPPRRFKLVFDPLSLWWGDNEGQPYSPTWRPAGGGIPCSTNEEALLLNPSS